MHANFKGGKGEYDGITTWGQGTPVSPSGNSERHVVGPPEQRPRTQ